MSLSLIVCKYFLEYTIILGIKFIAQFAHLKISLTFLFSVSFIFVKTFYKVCTKSSDNENVKSVI